MIKRFSLKIIAVFGAVVCIPSIATAQVKDPRACIGTPLLEAPTKNGVAVDLLWGIPRNRIGQCISQNNWPVALRPLLGGLSEWNYHKYAEAQKISRMGINASPITGYLVGRDEVNLKDVADKTYSEPLNAELLRSIENVNNKKLSPEQIQMVNNYLRYSAQVEYKLVAFARGLREVSHNTLSERWQILPAVEANKPIILPRTLSREEQSLAKKLSAEYIQSAQTRTYERLEQLNRLAQSGDKIAMLALRDALSKGPPWDVERHYLYLSIDSEPIKSVVAVMAAQWTARIWQMHGYEDEGRKAMNACVNGMYGPIMRDRQKGVTARLINNEVMGANSDGRTLDSTSEVCGFTLTGANSNVREGGYGNGKLISVLPRGAVNIKFYDTTGSTAPDKSRDFYITGVNFSPILGDAAAKEAKFQKHLAARKAGLIYRADGSQTNFTTTLGISYAWYQEYATETGRLQMLDDADSHANAVIRRRLAYQNDQLAAQWRSALARFNAEAPNPSMEAKRELQRVASRLGGSAWQEYERLVPNLYGNAPVQSTTTYNSIPNSPAVRNVEVRTYGAGGTYIGSQTTSAVWADIMKMGSGPPR